MSYAEHKQRALSICTGLQSRLTWASTVNRSILLFFSNLTQDEALLPRDKWTLINENSMLLSILGKRNDKALLKEVFASLVTLCENNEVKSAVLELFQNNMSIFTSEVLLQILCLTNTLFREGRVIIAEAFLNNPETLPRLMTRLKLDADITLFINLCKLLAANKNNRDQLLQALSGSFYNVSEKVVFHVIVDLLSSLYTEDAENTEKRIATLLTKNLISNDSGLALYNNLVLRIINLAERYHNPPTEFHTFVDTIVSMVLKTKSSTAKKQLYAGLYVATQVSTPNTISAGNSFFSIAIRHGLLTAEQLYQLIESDFFVLEESVNVFEKGSPSPAQMKEAVFSHIKELPHTEQKKILGQVFPSGELPKTPNKWRAFFYAARKLMGQPSAKKTDSVLGCMTQYYYTTLRTSPLIRSSRPMQTLYYPRRNETELTVFTPGHNVIIHKP